VVGPTVVVTEQADDLARAVDPTCSGALDKDGIIEGGRGIIEGGEDDRHVVALLVAYSSRQRTTSRFRTGGQAIRADLALMIDSRLILWTNALLAGPRSRRLLVFLTLSAWRRAQCSLYLRIWGAFRIAILLAIVGLLSCVLAAECRGGSKGTAAEQDERPRDFDRPIAAQTHAQRKSPTRRRNLASKR
jgi:hypothetical protein